MPDDKEYIKILIEQFVLKLKESFSNLNFDEILAAFRKNGLGVKDWGKNMNLDLICTVLADYTNSRIEASLAEERMKEKPVEISYTEEQLQDFKRQWAEEYYQRIRSGRLEAVPDYVRDIIVVDKYISKPEQADSFFVKWLNSGKENLYVKSE